MPARMLLIRVLDSRIREVPMQGSIPFDQFVFRAAIETNGRKRTSPTNHVDNVGLIWLGKDFERLFNKIRDLA